MKTSNLFFQKLVFCTVLFLSTINILNGATRTFTNGGGDNLWSNPANWNPAFVPDVNDDAIVNSGTLNVDLAIDVKSLTISGTATVTFIHTGTATIGDLTMSGGALSSTDPIVINNGLNWNGTASLTTTSYIELATTAVSSFSGSGNQNLYGKLINKGTCTHSGGSLRFHAGGSFENDGTYTVDGATFVINTGGGTFLNNGIFNKNNNNELNFFTGLDQAGTAVININAGTLKLLFGSTNKGSSAVNIANGATLNISSGNYTFGTTTSISGAGDLDILGGTTSVEGSVNITGTVSISGGTIDFNHPTSSSFSKLTLNGGTLQGSGPIVVNNQFNWSSTASINGTDSLTLTSTCNTNIFGGGTKSLYKTIINNGDLSHTGGNFRFYPGGSFLNNGIYAANGPTKIFDNGGGSFDNNGTFDHQKKSNFNFNPDFNNKETGIIKGQGNIDFSNLNNLGTFAADAAYGTLELKKGVDLNGGLAIEFDHANHGALAVKGNVLLDGELEVNVTGTVPAGSYTILSASSGAITGTFSSTTIPSGFGIQYTPTEVTLLSGVLPVEFTKFKVAAQRSAILLHWQTASESNSKNFIVEHSLDGQTFIAVGEVPAAGNSNALLDYGFTHGDPNIGANYYRLRQQDFDGTFEYSDLRVLNFYNLDKDITVYPNPTMGRVYIKNQSDKVLNIVIRDLSGKVVYARNEMTPGATSIDLSDLPKSMYTLELSDDGFYSHKEKLMILE